jgi:hypothetical protein
MTKRTSAQSRFLMLLFLLFALPALAHNIKIEIVNLTWIVGVDHVASFRAKAILPDGAHAMLTCQAGEKECAGFQSFSSEKPPDSGCDRSHMVVTCSATDLGYFSARRDGDDVLIYVPKGKRKYRITGSW